MLRKRDIRFPLLTLLSAVKTPGTQKSLLLNFRGLPPVAKTVTPFDGGETWLFAVSLNVAPVAPLKSKRVNP